MTTFAGVIIKAKKNHFDSYYIQWFEYVEDSTIFKPCVKSRNKG